MPMVQSAPIALPTPAVDRPPAPSTPLPLGHLLRPDGSGRPPAAAPRPPGRRAAPKLLRPTPGAARRAIDRDADRLLAAARGGALPAAWVRPGFALRVDRARHQLAPLGSLEALAASFAREAAHLRPWSPAPSALRVAYAVRALEVGSGLRIPPWATWLGALPAGAEASGT